MLNNLLVHWQMFCLLLKFRVQFNCVSILRTCIIYWEREPLVRHVMCYIERCVSIANQKT